MHIDTVNVRYLSNTLRLPLWRDFYLSVIAAALLLGLLLWREQPSSLLPLRWLLGIAYVLFLPGYWLQAALFPRAGDLDGVERLGLSLGLSVVFVPVIILILDALPWGLELWPIVWGQNVVIGLSIGVALWRRKRLPPEQVYVPGVDWQPRSWWEAQPPFSQRIYLLLASALLATSLAIGWIILVAGPDEFITEFYILGAEGRAEDYPHAARVGEPLQVTLGLINREQSTRRYRVEIWSVDPWVDERRQVAHVDPITLAVGEGYVQPLLWHMEWPGEDQMVEFLLFVEAQPEPYRRLRLWIDVAPAPAEPVSLFTPGAL